MVCCAMFFYLFLCYLCWLFSLLFLLCLFGLLCSFCLFCLRGLLCLFGLFCLLYLVVSPSLSCVCCLFPVLLFKKRRGDFTFEVADQFPLVQSLPNLFPTQFVIITCLAQRKLMCSCFCSDPEHCQRPQNDSKWSPNDPRMIQEWPQKSQPKKSVR